MPMMSIEGVKNAEVLIQERFRIVQQDLEEQRRRQFDSRARSYAKLTSTQPSRTARMNTARGEVPMLEGQAENRRTGDPTLWTVRVLRLTFNATGKAAEATPLESVQLPDRELAIAVGHQLIDRHSHEVLYSIGLGLVVLPSAEAPAEEQSDSQRYRVSAEAREQARMLGVSGDVEAAVSRMATYAAPFRHHPKANRRYEGLAMRVEQDVVTWFGRVDPAANPRISRRTSRRTK